MTYNCENCIHNEVCGNTIYPDKDGKCDCPNFKPKSRFVELPCEVGDYVLWDNGIEIQKKEVKGFYFKPSELGLRYILEDCIPIINIENIKGIVSREEAEKALAEKGR